MLNLLTARPLKSVVGVDERFHRTYTSTYAVYVPKWAGPLTAVNKPGIPTYGSFYQWGTDFDTWAFANNYKADRDENEDVQDSNGVTYHRYIVTVTFSTSPTDFPSGSQRQDPTIYPPKMSGSFLNYSNPAYRDKDGEPIVNSALELYDPPPEVDDSHDTLQLEFCTRTINLVQRSEFRNTVNSTPIWGLEARQVKLISWNWKVSYYGLVPYVTHNFEFHINRIEHPVSCQDTENTKVGWYTTLPNNGYRKINAEDKQETILDEFDQAKNKPTYLDCDGAISATQKWNVWAIEKEKDFHLIPGLPDPLPGPFVVS